MIRWDVIHGLAHGKADDKPVGEPMHRFSTQSQGAVAWHISCSSHGLFRGKAHGRVHGYLDISHGLSHGLHHGIAHVIDRTWIMPPCGIAH